MATSLPSKRDQIVRAATQLSRTQGICGTTLKDVSDASQVPLGNLYYYFKTREELNVAVLDACEEELKALLARLAPLDPRSWLTAYFEWLLEDPAESARLGCPFGSFAAQLRTLNDPAAPRAAKIVERYLDAVCRPLVVLGHSQAFAEGIFMGLQGVYTVAVALQDPELYTRGVEQVRTTVLDSLTDLSD